MSEDMLKRNGEIVSLVIEIRELKREAKHIPDLKHFPTLLWAMATDLTTIHSLRWTRDEMVKSMIYKQYHYIASNTTIPTKLREIHEKMDLLFPNVPDRYTARLFVMQYLTDPDIDSGILYDNLFHIKDASDRLISGQWLT